MLNHRGFLLFFCIEIWMIPSKIDQNKWLKNATPVKQPSEMIQRAILKIEKNLTLKLLNGGKPIIPMQPKHQDECTGIDLPVLYSIYFEQDMGAQTPKHRVFLLLDCIEIRIDTI